MKNFEEIKQIAEKCLHCSHPNCVKNCPLKNEIPTILEAICNHQIDKAKQILLQTSSSAWICSKLCNFEKKCYGSCVLNKTKEKGIPFYEIEQYLANLIKKEDFTCDVVLKKKKVAIIGAGISGITIAIEFAKAGFETTLFEKNNRIGGVIVESLPSFRFDDTIMEKYVAIFDRLQVQVKYNQTFGKNLQFADLVQYDCIIFALGTSVSRSLFEKNQYVLDGMDILRKAKQNEEYIQKRKVVVIGGGNVAMDVARTLSRNQNDVSIVYRRDLENAPASQKEIQDTLQDGVKILTLLAPIHPVYENRQVIGLEVEKTKLIEDENTNRKNFVSTGERKVVETEIIVEAIGQVADYSILKEKYPTLFRENGRIDELGICMDGQQIVAVTGDYLTGPTDFASASMTAKKTFQMIMEKIK